MASMPGYVGTGSSGANPADPVGGLPAYQPVPPSSSYTALSNALGGQPSLAGFLPGAVATPGGGTSGAPAVAGTPGAGTSGGLATPGHHTTITYPDSYGGHALVTHTPVGANTTQNFLGATPSNMSGWQGGFRGAAGHLPAGQQPQLPAGGLAALFAQLFGSGGFLGGVHPGTPATTPTVPPAGTPAQPPAAGSPWSSLAAWLQGGGHGTPWNPSGGPVGQA